jgi:ubiquinol-cytochrome c reductase cytochrome c1 subunit
MPHKLFAIKLLCVALMGGICLSVFASEEATLPPQQKWSFSAPFGTFDRASAQRGFLVYKSVCATCHSLALIKYRNLQEIGFSEKEVKAIAAQHEIVDGPNDEGEMFQRPALPSDPFVKPYANEQAARAANQGAYPPDLSLITKARIHGADYIVALLTGYKEPPKEIILYPGKSYNPYFPGGQISMPPPLSEGLVTYDDGTPATVEQMARDVATFLAWAAEPELEARKRLGIKMLISLAVLTFLLYLVKKAIWARVK